MNKNSKTNRGIYIPFDIVVNKELSDKEKLLFGVISGLTKLQGYCFASNEHLSKLFDVTPKTIKLCLTHLESLGFIRREYKGTERHIYIGNTIDLQSVEEIVLERDESNKQDSNKNVTHYYDTNSNKNVTLQRGNKNVTHNNINNKDYNNYYNNKLIISKDIISTEFDNSVVPTSSNKNSINIIKTLQNKKQSNKGIEEILLKEKIKKNTHADRTTATDTAETVKQRKKDRIAKNLKKHFLTNYEALLPQKVKDTFCEWLDSVIESGCGYSNKNIDANANILIKALQQLDEEQVCKQIELAIVQANKGLGYVFKEDTIKQLSRYANKTTTTTPIKKEIDWSQFCLDKRY